MSNEDFKFQPRARVRDKNGNFGTVMERRFGWDKPWCLTRAYGVLWDNPAELQVVAEDNLSAPSSHKPGDVVFYKGVECFVHAVAYTTGRLLPVNLVLYKSADPCRTQFYVDEKEVTKQCPAPTKLGADGLRVTVKIGDLPEVKKILAESAEALAVSERHRAQLGHDLEELAAEIVGLREENETEKTRAENWMKQCYRARHERDDAEREGATATKAANKNFGIAAARLHDATMVLSRIREAFGLRPNDGVSLAEFAEKLTSENAELRGLLNSERITAHLLLKTQRERLEAEVTRLATMVEAREKQPPKNAEVERLEAEIDRLSSELHRSRKGTAEA